MKIWERYFLQEIIKVFFLFISCFYILYVLIDFSTHLNSFVRSKGAYTEWMLYYAYTFAKRLTIIIPFALLIASIKTLCSLNVRNELVALLASGISIKRLMRPFLWVGLGCVLFLYITLETIIPYALKGIKRIEDSHFSKFKKEQSKEIQTLLLKDQSTLIYQGYDTSKDLFYDVYWIRSIDDIYHMKFLLPFVESPTGRFVDHLQRNPQGVLCKTETTNTKIFNEMI